MPPTFRRPNNWGGVLREPATLICSSHQHRILERYDPDRALTDHGPFAAFSIRTRTRSILV